MTTYRSRYFTPTPAERELGLYCLGVGSFHDVRTAQAPRTLECFAAVFVHEGHGVLRTGATRGDLEVRPGSLFWLFPQVRHEYAPGRTGWSEQWVLFDGTAARAYRRLGHLDPRRPLGTSSEASGLFRELLADTTDGIPDPIATIGTIHRLISHASALTGQGLTTVVHALAADAVKPGTVADRAGWLAMTPAALREAVRAAGAGTPHEVVLHTRLTLAKDLLAHTERPIHEVAHDVGFEDPAYFSRLFHRREGISPLAFRSQQTRLLTDAWATNASAQPTLDETRSS